MAANIIWSQSVQTNRFGTNLGPLRERNFEFPDCINDQFWSSIFPAPRDFENSLTVTEGMFFYPKKTMRIIVISVSDLNS